MCRPSALRPSNRMEQAGAAVLAVEAEKTILLEQDDLLRQADRAGIAVVAVRG